MLLEWKADAPVAAPPPLETLFASLPAALLVVDRTGRIVTVNAAAEELFGRGRGRLVSSHLSDHLRADSPLFALLERFEEGLQSLSERGLELALRRGRTLAVDVHLAVLPEHPELRLLLLLPCSVAERIDRHLWHAGSGRSVASLAMTLAHEVKNPLSGIRGAAQLLEEVVPEGERALLDLIVSETERITRLVEEMEVFADERPLRRAPVNIHLVLEHVRRVAEAGFGRHVRFVEAYDPSLPPVPGDRERLVQLFLNLVKNACEATPEGGRVILRTRYHHGIRVTVAENRKRLELPICVEVEDEGPGVPEHLREHLFEPFVSGRPGGRGLGLALVATITARHGGIVALAESRRGACFRVRLPAVREEA